MRLDDAFDQMMVLLPLWFPILLVLLGVQWLLVRSATRSALRAHARTTLPQDS